MSFHVAGAAAASTGAAPTAEASQEAASSGDSEFGSPQPGTEFSPEQPMEGDLGGDDFDLGQTGTYFKPCVPQSMHCLGAYTGDTHIACTVMPRYTCCVHVCDIIAMLWFCGLVRCQLLSSALRALGDVGN